VTGFEQRAHAAPSPRLAGSMTHLSERRLAVLRGLACGYPDKVIAQALGIGERTVRSHVASCLATLGGRSRPHLAALALADDVIAADLVGRAPVVDLTEIRELLTSTSGSGSAEPVAPSGDALLQAVNLGFAEEDVSPNEVGGSAR
jgi:DNA-binding CsgD family transcriptional regulator